MEESVLEPGAIGARSDATLHPESRPTIRPRLLDLPPPDWHEPAPKPKLPRLTSLDAFRGLTVILMLLVNNIALDTQTPAQLLHAGWNAGLTLADMVFPWFLLCVGLAIPFSHASAKRRGVPGSLYELRVLLRAVLLIGIGCLLESAAEKKPVFSMGVLQLIGFSYLMGAWGYEMPKMRRVLAALLLLGCYGLALKYFNVPGATPGTFTETTNWPLYMNNTFFGRFNLEGILSAIPCGALILLSTVFGDYLADPDKRHVQRIRLLTIGGLLMIGLGAWWNLALPYNKPYWTPSYILLCGGVGLLVLAVLYLLTDAVNTRKWTLPLVIFGANAIVAYALPIFVKLTMLSVWKVQTPTGPEPVLDHIIHVLKASMGNVYGGWSYTVGYIVFWGLLLWLLYWRKLFIRV